VPEQVSKRNLTHKTYDMRIYIVSPVLLEDTSLPEPSCHLPEVVTPDVKRSELSS
jgi:hypothetical protein